MLIPLAKVLADLAFVRHNWDRLLIPGSRCSQGGVKVPTGGKGEVAQARERLCRDEYSSRGRVSRFGVIPKPTVKVRMKENGCVGLARFRVALSFRMP
jgi:hypothetical protein